MNLVLVFVFVFGFFFGRQHKGDNGLFPVCRRGLLLLIRLDNMRYWRRYLDELSGRAYNARTRSWSER